MMRTDVDPAGGQSGNATARRAHAVYCQRPATRVTRRYEDTDTGAPSLNACLHRERSVSFRVDGTCRGKGTTGMSWTAPQKSKRHSA